MARQAPPDAARIAAGLDHLIGLPLWGARRAADLQGFHFGKPLTRSQRFGSHKGEAVTVGELALHVQCAWRISGPGGIVVASRDVFSRSVAVSSASESEWDWTAPGANRRDERLAAWLAAGPFVVEERSLDGRGGFSLRLSGDHVLEVFADVSGEAECWRLLFNDQGLDHLVVTGAGVEADDR